MSSKLITKGVVFTGKNKIEIQEKAVNEPAENEVLVKTESSLISTGTELNILTGKNTADWARFPYKAGYSHAGTIMKVGAGVSEFKEGDRICSSAEHTKFFAAVPEEKGVMKIPEGVSFEQAAFLNLGVTALNGVRLAKIELGNSVVIIGLGILGQLAMQFAGLNGASPVIGVDFSEKRLEIAKELGIDFVINPQKSNPEKLVSEFTEGRNADIVFDVTGNPKATFLAFFLVKRQGKIILLGTPLDKVETDVFTLLNRQGITFIGAHTDNHPICETPWNQWTLERNKKLILELMQKHRLSIDRLITHRFKSEEAVSAYQLLQKDRLNAMGVILNWKNEQ